MFVHLVLIKLKPGVTRIDPRVAAWQAVFNELPKKVDGILRWETGWNPRERPHAYDFGLNSAFATREHLEAFGPHPAHEEMVVRMREIADWVICDYEVGEWITD